MPDGAAQPVSESVGGLVPGRQVPLRLTVSNPNAQAIRLTAATATAAPASKTCPAGLLSITSYAGSPQTVVPGRGQAVVELSITLAADAPDSCRQVSFPLTYGGKAEQWH